MILSYLRALNKYKCILILVKLCQIKMRVGIVGYKIMGWMILVWMRRNYIFGITNFIKSTGGYIKTMWQQRLNVSRIF